MSPGREQTKASDTLRKKNRRDRFWIWEVPISQVVNKEKAAAKNRKKAFGEGGYAS